MIVLVTGDRNWTNYAFIHRRLRDLPPGSVVIEGEARGADRLARRAAEAEGFEVRPFPAAWDTHGRAAGPIRNREMLAQKPDLVIGFHDNIAASKGTADMLRIAESAGVPTELWDSSGRRVR